MDLARGVSLHTESKSATPSAETGEDSMNVLADVSQTNPVDAIFLVVLNSILFAFGCYVLVKSLMVLGKAHETIKGFEAPSEDTDVRWKAVAWLIEEQGFSLSDVKRINFQANQRDKLYTAKTLNELLPVGGFLGTILPLAWFFFSDPTSGGESLADAIIAPLGTALLTTVFGLGWFAVNALVQARAEAVLGKAERGFDAEARKRLVQAVRGSAVATGSLESEADSATKEKS